MYLTIIPLFQIKTKVNFVKTLRLCHHVSTIITISSGMLINMTNIVITSPPCSLLAIICQQFAEPTSHLYVWIQQCGSHCTTLESRISQILARWKIVYNEFNHFDWYLWMKTECNMSQCRWQSGDNQSVGSSVPVVSRWLWPRNRTFLEVASMMVTSWNG